jgi:uncharacterized protein involved in exopolysaccharide biosynthesis
VLDRLGADPVVENRAVDPNSPFEPTVLGAMWRYRLVVVAIVATAVALAVLYGVTRPAQHRAFATIVVQDPSTQSVFGVAQAERPERYVANQATILESNLVMARATELMLARGATGMQADPDAISVGIV